MGAAEEEFGRRGFANASINAICAAAGISKGSMFQYFADKEDLAVHLARTASDRMRAHIEAENQAMEPGTAFAVRCNTLLASWINYFYDNPIDRRLTAAVSIEVDPESGSAVRLTVSNAYRSVLTPLFRGAVESGQLRSDGDVEAVLSLLTMILPQLALAPHFAGQDSLFPPGADRATVIAHSSRVMQAAIASLLT